MKNLLIVSDHPSSPTGVGTQVRYLIKSLAETGEYKITVVGRVTVEKSGFNPDKDEFPENVEIIAREKDFGNPQMIRALLGGLKPDAFIMVTDIRHLRYLWDLEDEIRQICPMIYWHLWDNEPYPVFNEKYYDNLDVINCISKKTYDLLENKYKKKITHIPHTLPPDLFTALPSLDAKKKLRDEFILGKDRRDWFVATWINKNMTRKKPLDILVAWNDFLKVFEKRNGHRNAVLLMHTEPGNPTGLPIERMAYDLGLKNNLLTSSQKVTTNEINKIYQISDVSVNISSNEGFGLSLLESGVSGCPFIANYTGGMIDQIEKSIVCKDYLINPSCRTLIGGNGSYIYEDHIKIRYLTERFNQISMLSEEERFQLGQDCAKNMKEAFDFDKAQSDWIKSIEYAIKTFRPVGNNSFNLISF